MTSPYLEGAYAPVDDEASYTKLPVIGEIPEGLRGTYLRNGPNPQFAPKSSYHLWDGDGMLHALTFGDDGVSYRNRWVETAALQLERKLGRAVFGGMLDTDPPSKELRGELAPVKNPANTGIVRHAGRYLALWEAGLPTVVTEELETAGAENFSGKLQGPMTAHPKLDPISGELHFFGYSPIPPYLRYHVVDAAGKLVRSLEIDLPRAVMIHDFLVTQDHVLFFDSPAAFDLASLAQGGPVIRWAPEFGTRIGVMPRTGSAADMRWFEVEIGYIYHFLNGWSEGEVIKFSAPIAPWITIDFEHDAPPEGLDINAYLHEFSLDLGSGVCTRNRIGELPGEFCRVPDALVGLKNRYGYLATFSTGVEDDANFDSLTKYDLETGSAVLRRFGPDRVVGEPAFAPNLKRAGQGDPSGGGAEDDGWIVTYVHERDGSASEFIVLDARDLAGEPVARIPMPRRVPLGFHGNWMTP
jgi:carotenoid cleavage dioxygenase